MSLQFPGQLQRIPTRGAIQIFQDLLAQQQIPDRPPDQIHRFRPIAEKGKHRVLRQEGEKGTGETVQEEASGSKGCRWINASRRVSSSASPTSRPMGNPTAIREIRRSGKCSLNQSSKK